MPVLNWPARLAPSGHQDGSWNRHVRPHRSCAVPSLSSRRRWWSAGALRWSVWCGSSPSHVQQARQAARSPWCFWTGSVWAWRGGAGVENGISMYRILENCVQHLYLFLNRTIRNPCWSVRVWNQGKSNYVADIHKNTSLFIIQCQVSLFNTSQLV